MAFDSLPAGATHMSAVGSECRHTMKGSIPTHTCHLRWPVDDWLVSNLWSPGQQPGQADGGRGLRRVHLQVFREQRPRRLSRHHAGVRRPRPPASTQTCWLTSRPQASLSAAAADWDSRTPARHQEGPGQELRAHVVGGGISRDCTRGPNLLVNSCQFFALHKEQ